MRVEVFSKMSATFLRCIRCRSLPVYLARFKSRDRSSRNCSSLVVKSNSLRKSRLRRLTGMVVLSDCFLCYLLLVASGC